MSESLARGGTLGELRQRTEARLARWGHPEAHPLPPVEVVAHQTHAFAAFKALYSRMATLLPGMDVDRVALEVGKPGMELWLKRLWERSHRPASARRTLGYLARHLGKRYATIADAVEAGDARPVAGTLHFTVTPRALIQHELGIQW